MRCAARSASTTRRTEAPYVTRVTMAFTTAVMPATARTTPITRNTAERWRQHGRAIAMHAAPTSSSITAVTEVTMPEATG